MEAETYRFTIGDFECVALNDGYHDYPVDGFFATAPPEQITRELEARGRPTDKIVSPYALLYVDTGDHQVLIDTGGGKIVPGVGMLMTGLSEEGVRAEDVDTLIITHAHGDHTGGLLTEEFKPAFPNAQMYTQKEEWDFWMTEEAKRKFPSSRAFELVERIVNVLGERFRYIEPDCEILPGITALAAPGHTPGHFAVRVASGSDSVIYISDTVFHPLHLEHLDWLPVERYRLEPDEYPRSIRRIFDRAVAEGALVLGMHFEPFPSLGYASRKGDVWQWSAIE
jgi:glyoxylase-like metal-dependent hydrolase (beta-lactamase superfamily II)